MILKTLAALALAGGIIAQVSSCSAPSIDVSTVIQDAKLACAFVPTAATVASLISANPNVATAEQVAATICQAIGNASPAPSAGAAPASDADHLITKVVVNGKEVDIIGHYVASESHKK